MPRSKDHRAETRSRSPRRNKGASSNVAAEVQQRALNVVMQQFLSAQDEGDYQLYGVNARDFATDAKGVIALHNACKQLASHDISGWYNNILFCYHENKEEARMADPAEARRQEYENLKIQKLKHERAIFWSTPASWSAACPPARARDKPRRFTLRRAFSAISRLQLQSNDATRSNGENINVHCQENQTTKTWRHF